MVSVLNYSPKVHVIRAHSELHYDWDAYLDRLYKRPAAGTVNKNHIFRADVNQPGQLRTESIKGFDMKVQNLSKIKITSTGATKAGRTRILKYGKVEVIEPPGLKPIKQVELYKNWRPLVPDEYKDAICPKPSDAILEVVKKERAEKKKKKIVQKKTAPKKKAQKKKVPKKKAPKKKGR